MPQTGAQPVIGLAHQHGRVTGVRMPRDGTRLTTHAHSVGIRDLSAAILRRSAPVPKQIGGQVRVGPVTVLDVLFLCPFQNAGFPAQLCSSRVSASGRVRAEWQSLAVIFGAHL